jgi:hypothetical protein
MTAVAPRFGTPVTRSYSLLRCSARQIDHPGDQGRCQLRAGHDGSHAVMYVNEGRRTVRSWSSAAPDAWVDSVDSLQRPWMTGMPMPAWTHGAA